jgi:hypothetical protein
VVAPPLVSPPPSAIVTHQAQADKATLAADRAALPGAGTWVVDKVMLAGMATLLVDKVTPAGPAMLAGDGSTLPSSAMLADDKVTLADRVTLVVDSLAGTATLVDDTGIPEGMAISVVAMATLVGTVIEAGTVTQVGTVLPAGAFRWSMIRIRLSSNRASFRRPSTAWPPARSAQW